MHLSALTVLAESVWLSLCVGRIVREVDDTMDHIPDDGTDEGIVICVFTLHLSTCSDICFTGPIPIRRDIQLVYGSTDDDVTPPSPYHRLYYRLYYHLLNRQYQHHHQQYTVHQDLAKDFTSLRHQYLSTLIQLMMSFSCLRTSLSGDWSQHLYQNHCQVRYFW